MSSRDSAAPGAAPPTTDLRPLFAPRSIAVVGASPRSPLARVVRDNLVRMGSETRCHFVNPNYAEARVSLTWAPSASSAATGYRVLRSTTPGSGNVEVSTVTPVGASAGADSPGDGTWYYVLRTFLGSWSSSSSNEASVTLGSVLTGYHACASGVADTGGDGNGYETGAASGCITDGAYASDASSGTNTVNSCADSGKDRHRFWGFALGLPAGVTSIDGIGLRLVAGMNNGAGASQICAELSWDGGASWTAPKAVTLTTSALTAYDLGSITDTWGRAWTAPELGTSTFRLRLIDASTRANKTFRLDGLSVEVAYTP